MGRAYTYMHKYYVKYKFKRSTQEVVWKPWQQGSKLPIQ